MVRQHLQDKRGWATKFKSQRYTGSLGAGFWSDFPSLSLNFPIYKMS